LSVLGDERIAHDEFVEGLKSLQSQLGSKFTHAQIDALLKYIDVDGDGFISYSEFFDSFALMDEKLNSTLERSKSMRQRDEATEAEPEGSLSPQHAADVSPPDTPQHTHFLNPASDHDATSTSHMLHHKHALAAEHETNETTRAASPPPKRHRSEEKASES
jgi:hypothetical protein